jgi:Lsr2
MAGATKSSIQPIELYPLDAYLESHIGAVELYDAQWTPELTNVVVTYLTNELPDDQYTVFLANLYSDAPPEGTREDQVQFILAHHDPFDLHGVSHYAAVETAPSFEAVVASEFAHEYGLVHTDAGWWLYANATHEQCIALVRELDPLDPALTAVDENGESTLDIVYLLDAREPSPDRLLQAWEKVSEQSDLNPQLAPTAPRGTTGAIRAWARERSLPVGDRGRIPASIVEQYTAATQ